MLNRIKYLGIIFLSILLFTNCKKDAKQDQIKQGELVFAPIDITPDKVDWDYECDLTLTVTHAKVTIDGEDYYPLTFVLDGKLYTQAIKLDAGAHVLEFFALMDNMDTPDFYLDDEIVKATPLDDSDFAGFVEYTLPVPLTIIAFQKFELKIDVLCYIPAAYEYFGFFWFEVIEMTIREQCFFGDFCIKYPDDYTGSFYDDINGVQIDEVAIFKIVAYRNGDPIGEFENTYMEEDNLIYYEPLCIQYGDYDNTEDYFLFELWIYVKVGESYEYVWFHNWEFMNAEMIVPAYPVSDGIVEFVLGNCNYTETDLLLPPLIFTGRSDFIAPGDPGTVTQLPSGQTLIEGQTAEWFDTADDWRATGTTMWVVNWLIEADPPNTAELWGTAELFVEGDRGKWEITWHGYQTPTPGGFVILVEGVGTGVEGEVLGMVGNWIYMMDIENGFFYTTEGEIH